MRHLKARTLKVNVRGISSALLRTEGTVTLALFTPMHETTHTFHIMGDSFDCQYDGILGQDFWKNKRATINYCDCTTAMGLIMINRVVSETHKLTSKTRIESIVQDGREVTVHPDNTHLRHNLSLHSTAQHALQCKMVVWQVSKIVHT